MKKSFLISLLLFFFSSPAITEVICKWTVYGQKCYETGGGGCGNNSDCDGGNNYEALIYYQDPWIYRQQLKSYYRGNYDSWYNDITVEPNMELQMKRDFGSQMEQQRFQSNSPNYQYYNQR